MRKILNQIFNFFLNILFSNKKDSIQTVYIEDRSQLIWSAEDVGRRIKLNMFEKEETLYFKNNIKIGDICLDVGSNVGYFTNLFASLVGDSGRVIALDAVIRNVELVKLNTILNKTQNIVDVHCAAIGDVDDKDVYFNTTNDSAYAFIEGANDRNITYVGIEESKETISMKTRTIDSILMEYNINHVDIMKMDIEGYEYFALKGMVKYLSSEHMKPKIIMLELADNHLKQHGKQVIDVIQLMENHKYSSRVLINNELIPYNSKYPNTNVFFIL